MHNRDHDYLNFLRDYFAKHHALPSFSVIAKMVGLKSTSAVAAMVNRLKSESYLESAPDKRLKPGKNFFEREILGSVQAGMPTPANDVLVESLSIDSYLIDQPSRSVLLTVKGDSMIDAGLLPGDYVVVKKEAPTRAGDIVVAIVDNEYTIKYLAADSKGGFYLKPGNKEFPDIRASGHLQIFGLVLGSFRKYGK